MSGRDAIIRAALDGWGWGDGELVALPADASFRRYLRLSAPGLRAIVMDAPPPAEDVTPFLQVADCLHALGLSAPRILAADQDRGVLVLEDLGDDTFTRLLDSGADAEQLYTLAVDVLIRIASAPAETACRDLAPYDSTLLLAETALFVDWYLPAVTGRPAAPGARDAFLAAWQAVLPPALEVPHGLVLRDFHVDNLMRLSGRRGVAACGLLDFQDAVMGPLTYDLMSLVEDARRDVPEFLRQRMVARFRDGVPGFDPTAFERSFAILAAQRHCKVIGIFTRLFERDAKPGYLVHIPRVWRLLARHLENPALAPVRAWLDATLPAEARIAPACARGPAA
ncbi:MAG: phosphotransferase [Alphaproteobacteria bacterium]